MIDLTGGNPHRSRAMSNAARTIERLEEPVVELLAQGTLTTIRGIGDGLAAQIQEIADTGTFETREDLLGAIPAGVLDIMRVKGLGAKKVRAIWQQLSIISLAELEQAAMAGRLATLDGFGAKTQANVIKNLQLLKTYSNQRRYADVWTFLSPVLERINQYPGIQNAHPSGQLRRKLETISEIDLVLVIAPDALEDDIFDDETVQPALADLYGGNAFTRTGHTVSGQIELGLPLRVHLVTEHEAGSLLWKTTGAAAHIEQYIDAYGDPGDVADEASIYEKASLSYIPPELREGTGELNSARDGSLPALIETTDLQGTLHNHSTYSDGAHSLEQMALAARSMGLSYFGICDHSRSLVIANGLSIERVRDQHEEIRSLNRQFETSGNAPFKIFSGIESDILPDGSLDYPDDVLASFDFVVASVHIRMNMDIEEATNRLIEAIKNPYTTILGHPTGRILLVREGYPIDYERVLDACARHSVAVELNANPYRLDLDWRWIREAAQRGIFISINPDAHAMDGLNDMRWGVEVARKGWLTRDQCLNALPLEAFESWLAQRSHA